MTICRHRIEPAIVTILVSVCLCILPISGTSAVMSKKSAVKSSVVDRNTCRSARSGTQHTADCHQPGSKQGLSITNNDTINIIATSVTPQVVGLDGSKKSDTLINNGVINISVLDLLDLTTQPSSNIDVVGDDYGLANEKKRHTSGKEYEHDNWLDKINKLTPDVIGIAGRKANDTIINNGALNITTANQLTDQTGSTAMNVVGMAGQDGNDVIENTGTLVAQSTASINLHNVNVEFINSGDASQNIQAISQGLTGGNGNDTITNRGQIQVIANANDTVQTFDISLLGGISDFDASTSVVAAAVGINGMDGNDTLVNQGSLSVTSNANVDKQTYAFTLVDGLATINNNVTAKAIAAGIHAGDGNNRIENSGPLDVSASADLNSWDVNISAVQLASGGSALKTVSAAIGLGTGDGNDVISNSAALNVAADATTSSKNIQVSLLDLSVFGTGGDSSTAAKSSVMGIDAGDGNNAISNTGALHAAVTASASAFDFSWSANSIPDYLGSYNDYVNSTPLIDAGTTAKSQVIGIRTGRGEDSIVNSGTLSASARADVSSTSVSVEFPFPDLIPIKLPEVNFTQTATQADSMAMGISTGKGDDVIKNSGQVNADATSNAITTSVAVSVMPKVELPSAPIDLSFIGASMVDVGAYAYSDSIGVDTGKGDDAVFNSGGITANSSANSIATNVSVKLAQSDDKVSFNLSVADASTISQAGSTSVNLSAGDDFIKNVGDLTATSHANTISTAVDVDMELLSDTLLSLGAKFVAADTASKSTSVGIDAGSGDNVVLNLGNILALTNADAVATSVTVGVLAQPGKDFGIIGQGNIASSDTLTTANAFGILSGAGHDRIKNTGLVQTDANANSTSVGVAVNATGTKKGAAIGVAISSADSIANATGTGVATDGGKDVIYNDGVIDANADSKATSIAVSVAADFVSTGLAGGVAYTTAKTQASAESTAINSGSSADKIVNTGDIKSNASSAVVVGSVAGSVGGAQKGVSLQGAAADGSSTANSNAAGILGEAGNDVIQNSGQLAIVADAKSTTVSVSVAAQGVDKGVGLGVALARAVTKSDATALGVSGGDDNDTINNQGALTTLAQANTNSVGVSVGLGVANTGLSLAGTGVDAATQSDANSTGISGGNGKDNISNDATLTSNALASGHSTSVAVTLHGSMEGVTAGAALARASTDVNAVSIGISGGDASDVINNTGAIHSFASANTIATGVAVDIGAANTGLTISGSAADTSTLSTALSHGITGDAGNDLLMNQGDIDSTSSAVANSNSVGVSINGAVTGVSLGVALARAATEGSATSEGMTGGSGNDRITNSGHISSDAKADVTSVGVSVAAGGAGEGLAIEGAAADTSSIGNAIAMGLNGGRGIDSIYNEGLLDVSADAKVHSDSIGVSISGTGAGVGVGVSLARTDTRATATATGISLGGAGDGFTTIHDEHEQTKVSYAQQTHADDDSHHSVSNSDDQHRGDVDHEGDQKEVIEYLTNTGNINSNAHADATSVSVSVQLGLTGTGVQAGGALADASARSLASSNGIEGSDHKDIIQNQGVINTNAAANTQTTSVSVSLNASLEGATLSGAVTDATALANADSIGIAGLAGNDQINNAGTINATSSAKTNAVSVAIPIGFSYVPLGVAIADNHATSTALSFGIDGGDGNDLLISSGTLLADATSTANGVTVSVTPVGMSLASADITANAAATGMEGGAGNDAIQQTLNAVLTARSHATATGTVVSVALAGAVFGDASTTANANSMGISGGAGKDQIDNQGTIIADADSSATGTSVSVNVAGASFADVTTNSISHAVGINTGADNDQVVNTGLITAKAHSGGKATSVGVGLLGFNDVDASTNMVATSGGIELGSGDDALLNQGDIQIMANSDVTAKTFAPSLVGVASAKANLIASVVAEGISGGAGNDLLINRGIITIGSADGVAGWMSRMTSTGISFNLAGVANAESAMYANTLSIGIDGGTGNDRIYNSGELNINATAYNSSSATTVGIFGTAASGGISGAVTKAMGISGGAGHDKIENSAMVDVTAKAGVDMSATTFDFGGSSNAGAQLAAKSNAIGIEGGDDADFIKSSELVRVTSSSSLVSTGKSTAIFGGSAANAIVGAITDATGIDGGDGDDVIINLATINLTANSSVNSTSSAYTFAGGSGSNAVLNGRTTATGINGGNGSDFIYSNGAILIDATSLLTTTGGTKSTFGSTSTSGLSAATASAKGIDAAQGDDIIVNAGQITLNVFADATAKNNAKSGWLTGDGDTDSKTQTFVNGIGIDGGTGNNVIKNTAAIDVTTSGIGYGFSYSSGAHFSWDGDGTSLSSSYIDSTATGIQAGNENNLVINAGSLTTLAKASTIKTLTETVRFWSEQQNPDPNSPPTPIVTVDTKTLPGLPDNNYPEGKTIYWSQDPSIGQTDYVAAYRVTKNSNGDLVWVHIAGYFIEKTIIIDNSPTYAFANGNGVTGTGTAKAYGTSYATAYGIHLGDGDNTIVNKGDITVTARPEAVTSVVADGDAFGDAVGTTVSYASAKAYGISVGAGNNWIKNEGAISVTAAPRASGEIRVSGGDICIWFFGWWCGGGGDGIANANTTYNSLAVGILSGVGTGVNEIHNSGVITVASLPESTGFTTQVSGDATPVYESAVTSKAIGIWTQGSGNSHIVNTGEINVTANNVPGGYSCSDGSCATSVEAIGILTGSGNDVIVNKGRIIASSTGANPVAIRTGAGNDVVSLADGSMTSGAIDLGANDDTLNIFGTPIVNGSISGGSDTDTVVFHGEGTFANPLSNFENTVKLDAGVYNLSELAPMRTITVKDGVLRVNGDYTFNVDGTFVPVVSSDHHGQFEVTGTVMLAGDINVIRGRGHYMDGDHYDVLKAAKGFLSNTSFDNILVPKDAPLLRFHHEINADTLQIYTEVKPFVSVAHNNNEMAIASCLDRILANSVGDVSATLGEIQALGANEHARAYANLSPENYAQVSRVAMSSVRKYNNNLQQRMRTLREEKLFNQKSQYYTELDQRADGGNSSHSMIYEVSNVLQTMRNKNSFGDGIWLKGFNQSGAAEFNPQVAGLTFNQEGQSLGFDSNISPNWIMGGSYGVVGTKLDIAANSGAGDINSNLYSLYGSYFTSAGYVDFTFSKGQHDYLNQRNYSVGSIAASTNSEHGADVLTSSITTGYYLPLRAKRLELFASLQYVRQNEAGFQEAGSGGIPLSVAPNKTESLLSQLGVRLGQEYVGNSYRLFSEVGIGWLHDFDQNANQVSASFVGVPYSSFTVTEDQIATDGIFINAGMTLSSHKGLQTSLDYNTEVRRDFTSQSIMGNLHYAF